MLTMNEPWLLKKSTSISIASFKWMNDWINFYSEQSIYKVNTENTAIG